MELPWDFVVPGVPVSIQTKNRARKAQWKTSVAAAASAAWPPGQSPLTEKLRIQITYFHDSAPLDVDNQMKLIQDALSGIVFVDDSQLTDRHGHLRDLNGAYRVRGKMTAELGKGFSFDGPFVHVKLLAQGDIEELP